MKTLTEKMADLVNTGPHLKQWIYQGLQTQIITHNKKIRQSSPTKALMFKLAELKSINNDAVLFEVTSENMPAAICGEGCATNMKTSRLLETCYGLKSPFSRYACHASVGTIRRLCKSVSSS